MLSTKLPVAEVLANLEAQMAFLRQQEAYHAEQEVFHREQRAAHAAALENAARHYEAFGGVAGSAAELAGRRTAAAEGTEAAPEAQGGKRVLRSRLVSRLATERPAGEPFSASDLAAEVNRRFGAAMDQPADIRLAAAALRRLVTKGVLKVVRPGLPHHEALYARS